MKRQRKTVFAPSKLRFFCLFFSCQRASQLKIISKQNSFALMFTSLVLDISVSRGLFDIIGERVYRRKGLQKMRKNIQYLAYQSVLDPVTVKSRLYLCQRERRKERLSE